MADTCLTQDELKSYLGGQMKREKKADAAVHFSECETCLEKLVAVYEFEEAGRKTYPQDHAELVKQIQGFISDSSEPSETDDADAEEVKDAVRTSQKKSKKRSPSLRPSKKGDSAEVKTGTGSLSRVRKRSDHSTVWALIGGIMFIVLIVIFFIMMGRRKERVAPGEEKTQPESEAEMLKIVPYIGQLMKAVEPGSVTVDGKEAGILKELHEGSTLKVAENGFATLSLDYDVILHVDGNSKLKIGKTDLSADANSVTLTILTGNVFADIPSTTGQTRFRMRMGSVVLSGPGSEMYVSAEKSVVASTKGAFSYKLDSGKEGTVPTKRAVALPSEEDRKIDASWFGWMNKQGVKFGMASETRQEVKPDDNADTNQDTQESKDDTKPDETYRPVSGKGIYRDGFEGVSLKNWIEAKGTWLPSRGVVRHTSMEKRGFLILRNRSIEHARISVDIKSVDGSAGLVFSYISNGYIIARWNDNGTCEVVAVKGSDDEVIQKEDCPKPSLDTGGTFSVEVRGKRVMVKINNKIIMQTRIIDAVTVGAVGLIAENNPSCVFDNFLVTELKQGGI